MEAAAYARMVTPPLWPAPNPSCAAATAAGIPASASVHEVEPEPGKERVWSSLFFRLRRLPSCPLSLFTSTEVGGALLSYLLHPFLTRTPWRGVDRSDNSRCTIGGWPSKVQNLVRCSRKCLQPSVQHCCHRSYHIFEFIWSPLILNAPCTAKG